MNMIVEIQAPLPENHIKKIVCSNGNIRATFLVLPNGRINPSPVARQKEAHVYVPGAVYIPKADYRQMISQMYGVLADAKRTVSSGGSK